MKVKKQLYRMKELCERMKELCSKNYSSKNLLLIPNFFAEGFPPVILLTLYSINYENVTKTNTIGSKSFQCYRKVMVRPTVTALKILILVGF